MIVGIRGKKKKELEQTESSCWEISVIKRQECTHINSTYKNSRANKTECSLPTHVMLLSRNITTLSLRIQVVPFDSQQHVQITARHNFDSHPNEGLLLSRVRRVVCSDCHVTSFVRSESSVLWRYVVL